MRHRRGEKNFRLFDFRWNLFDGQRSNLDGVGRSQFDLEQLPVQPIALASEFLHDLDEERERNEKNIRLERMNELFEDVLIVGDGVEHSSEDFANVDSIAERDVELCEWLNRNVSSRWVRRMANDSSIHLHKRATPLVRKNETTSTDRHSR